MLPSIGFIQRLRRAHRHLEDQTGQDIGRKELGDLVAAEMGREKPYAAGTVSDWFTEGVRDVDVIWGIAQACGVSFPWLAAGQGPMRVGPLAAEREVELNPLPRTPADEGMRRIREQLDAEAGDDKRPVPGARRRRTR